MIDLSNPQRDMFRSTSQLNLFMAGVRGGKTFFTAPKSYEYIQMFPEVRGFIAANTYEQLNTSTLVTIYGIWKEMGILEYDKNNPNGFYVAGIQPPAHFKKFHDFETYNNIISFRNGASVHIASMDNAKAHDGKEIGWAFLDETKDTKESDVKDVILARMSGRGIYIKDGQLSRDPSGEPFNPVYFTTSPAKVAWLNEMFELEKNIAEIEANIYSDTTYFKKQFGNKFVTVSSTYHNLHNLPSNYIENYKQNNSQERVKALIYANPFSSAGGEFYSSFSRLDHVREVNYNPLLPIHVSFDQNVVPYNSCSIWQIEKNYEKWDVRGIGEIALQSPRNSTEEVCEEVLKKYGDCPYIFFYGDASGKSRSVLDKETKHHYQVIERVLSRKLANGSNRVLRRNPGLVSRREFVNKLFEDKLPINLYVSPNCTKLLADFTYIKQDVDGGKKKEIVTDPDTGERYQKLGHMSDNFDYFICSAFSEYFNKK